MYASERQNPHLAFNLSGVDVLTDQLVHRVLLQKQEKLKEPRAVGVELVSRETIAARTSVIICSGVYNSPKLLMLSGIGSAT